MKGLFVVIFLGALIVLLALGCEVEVYTYNLPGTATAGASVVATSVAAPRVRTAAEERWFLRVDGECARRNAEALALGRPSTPGQLARYSERLVQVYRVHAQRAFAVAPPASAAGDARWVAEVETSKLRALDRIRRAASALDVRGAERQIRRFRTIASQASPQLVQLGLRECARFD